MTTATVAEYQARMFKALELTAQMRRAQREFFKVRSRAALLESQRLEIEVDRILAELEISGPSGEEP